MTISLILAMDEKRGIGINNKMPWHLPGEMAYFRKTTRDHTVLMGRKTFESIGKPLPKRHNVILTRDLSFSAEGCEVIHSVEVLVSKYGMAGEQEELFVIGGAEIYRMLLPFADKLYITEIAHTFEVDSYFDLIDYTQWNAISREKGPKDDNNPYDYEFVVYERLT